MNQHIRNNLKNVWGWRTAEQLVVIAVDDYGNVRQDSVASKQRMVEAGLSMNGRFDSFDAVETREDLEALYEVLTSVSDGKGRPAVFTPYALCANPDFDAINADDALYRYEALPRTFARLEESHGKAYRGAWDLWQEGIRMGIFQPQFHGREHLNIDLIEQKLRSCDKALRINLENRSMTALAGEPSMPGVGYTHAFGVSDRSELTRHKSIIADGLQLFENVFGFPSTTFTPPAQKLHPDLYSYVESLDVRGIDKPSSCLRRIDRHKTQREFNFLGCRRSQDHVSLVRNVVFEPTSDRGVDSVSWALDQIQAAFRWRRPAIISSHRVNFAGHIDPANREFGLSELKRLLTRIVERWPDARFISADGLVANIEETMQ